MCVRSVADAECASFSIINKPTQRSATTGITKWNQFQALAIGKQLPRRAAHRLRMTSRFHFIAFRISSNICFSGDKRRKRWRRRRREKKINKKNNFRRDYESNTVTNATLKQWKNISRPYGTVRATADGRQFYIAFFMSTAILCHIFFSLHNRRPSLYAIVRSLRCRWRCSKAKTQRINSP